MDEKFVNPTKKRVNYGGLNVVRLSPTDQKVIIDYTFDHELVKKTVIRCYIYDVKNITTPIYEFSQPSESYGTFEITPIYNHFDYAVILKAFFNDKEVGSSSYRIFRCGFVPGLVINYIHPEDYTFDTSGRSPASPSILKASDGALYVSHDIYWGGGGQNITQVFKSEDNGITWKYISEIYPAFWTKIFEHNNKLYALGNSQEYGDLNIFESEDKGLSWSKPTAILQGYDRATGGPHKAPMPVVVFNNRVWTGIDYGTWDLEEKHSSGAISCDVNDDLMVAQNWTCTGYIRQDTTWLNPPTPVEGARGTLEGNIVVGKDGELYNFLRYQNEECTPNYAKAVMLKINKNKPAELPTFHAFVDFRGNLTKFDILFDERTQKYYSLVNDVTQKKNLFQRNNVSLMVSDDLYNWKLLRGILNYEDNCYDESSKKVGFQYTSFIFDNEDIIAATRTAINSAYNFHNANYITLHRIKDYDISL